MITKEVARLVYNCYSEIESGNKMIEALKKSVNENGEFELKDEWGRTKGLELRIPNENNSWSIKQVPFDIAITTIEKHIENQERELERLKTVCRALLK